MVVAVVVVDWNVQPDAAPEVDVDLEAVAARESFAVPWKKST